METDIIYSPSQNAFYATKLNYPNLPNDCIPITNETHFYLLKEQSLGKQIVPGLDGKPVVIKKPITWENIRDQRNELLKESDWSTNSDSQPKPNKEAWLNYRQALRDITKTYSSPEAVIWPTKPA